ncbi:MAG TPA: hypothetical protein VGH31_05940 [Acidimicrobiales bacterium]
MHRQGLRSGIRRWAIVAIGAAGLLSGCSVGINAGDTPTLTGPIPARPTPLAGPTIRGAAVVGGRAAAGATVIVTTVLQADEVAGRGLKAAATLGIGCLDQVGCSSPTSEGRVAQNGRFILAVPKGGHRDDGLSVTVLDQRGKVGRAATSVLLPSPDRKGADIGSLVLAGSAGTVISRDNLSHYMAAVVPGQAGRPDITMARAVATSTGDQFVTEDPVQDVTSGFDPRLVEDGRVLLASTATGTMAGHQAIFTSSLVFDGDLVPPSRGAACSVEGGEGQPIDQHPCGLTSGLLDTDWVVHDDPACREGPCPGTAQDQVRDVTVRLAHPVQANLIVVRGCGFTCQVALSSDGRTFGAWRQAPQAAGTAVVFADQVPDQPVVAVRVQTATGGFFTSLRQVSVWEPLVPLSS